MRYNHRRGKHSGVVRTSVDKYVRNSNHLTYYIKLCSQRLLQALPMIFKDGDHQLSFSLLCSCFETQYLGDGDNSISRMKPLIMVVWRAASIDTGALSAFKVPHVLVLSERGGLIFPVWANGVYLHNKDKDLFLAWISYS